MSKRGARSVPGEDVAEPDDAVVGVAQVGVADGDDVEHLLPDVGRGPQPAGWLEERGAVESSGGVVGRLGVAVGLE